jgi:formiminoglutamase
LGKALDDYDRPSVVIIGFPSDEGVRRNGGRTGAAGAPEAVRQALYKMTPDVENPGAFSGLVSRTKDLGNLEVTGDVEQDQQVLGETLSSYLQDGIVPVILGGGHETAFAHFSGYAEAGLNTSILNLDAHADVRPLKDGQAHSGSPFRQAIEHESKRCEKYLVAGLQPHSVANSHREYIVQHNGRCLFKDETNITTISGLFHEHDSERLMVTFDMDAVDQAFAPGVSAPCANGLSPDLWLTAAYLAGRNEQVSSFDLSEVNPQQDRDNQTVRLAALTIWHFLLGLSQR